MSRDNRSRFLYGGQGAIFFEAPKELRATYFLWATWVNRTCRSTKEKIADEQQDRRRSYVIVHLEFYYIRYYMRYRKERIYSDCACRYLNERNTWLEICVPFSILCVEKHLTCRVRLLRRKRPRFRKYRLWNKLCVRQRYWGECIFCLCCLAIIYLAVITAAVIFVI